MVYVLIAIKDRAVNAYMPLANVRHEGEALRLFKDLIQEAGTPQNRHPDDYDLYFMGSFNDQTGEIAPCEPRKIADGKSMAEMIRSNT